MLSREKRETNPFQSLDFSQIKSLSFDYPVPERFLGFTCKAGRRGGLSALLWTDEALVSATSPEICLEIYLLFWKNFRTRSEASKARRSESHLPRAIS